MTGIGTLREGSLHADLKRWLARPGDRFEQPVDGFIVDMVRGDMMIEVQTGGFAPLRHKIEHLLEQHYRVRVVAPVMRTRTVVRVDADGAVMSRRRSPVRGRLEDVFERLVSLAGFIACERFEVEVLATAEIERRVHVAGKAWRRKGWVIEGRALDDVLERELIRGPADLAALLPYGLREPFSTADVAAAASMPRALAQQMLYCLHAAGAVVRAGKAGNAHLYRRGA